MTRKTSLVVLLMLLTAGTAVAAMSGTYYIKKGVSSADTFPSFVAAGNTLQAQGMEGNCTFLAFAGVYDEGTCHLQNIAGDTAYITTFDKVPGQGEVVVTASGYCFYIYYNCNVKIKNFTLRASSYGVYSYYSSGVKVEGCRILGSSYGCMMYYAHYDSVVGCLICPSSVGIYFYGTYSPTSKRNHASNNMVCGYSSYAIYSYYNDSLELYYNTFSSASSYIIYANYAHAWRIKDNIFKQDGGYVMYMPDSSLAYCDWNCYPESSPGGRFISLNGREYPNLAAWQAVGRDSHSIYADPLVGGGWNPHLTDSSPCINRGDTITGIAADIDGDARGAPPCIGADEYTSVGPAMSGVYTIKKDGGGDFSSFFDAMMAVWWRGFGGDVTFEAYAGNYLEQIRCLELNNGDCFLTFQAHQSTDGTDEVRLTPGSSCGIWNTDVSRVRFIDLKVGGYTSYGAYNQTLTSSAPYKGCDTVTYRRCTFSGANPMYFDYSSNDDSVVDCQLYSSSSYGIYSYASAADPSGPLVFINNFVVGYTSYGLYSHYNDGNQFYYNTFYSPSSNYCIYDYFSTTVPTFHNNILMNDNRSPLVYMYRAAVVPTGAFNYNCWYSPLAETIAMFPGAGGGTWEDLRAAGYEAHGLNRDPLIGGVLNPHLNTGSPCIDSGCAITDIERDIDGEKRDSGRCPDSS